MKYKLLFLCSIFLLFIGCGRDIPTQAQRLATLKSLTSSDSYKFETIDTSTYSFFTVQDMQKNSCDTINLYIEGDGLSWITRSIRSDDPTPLNPIAFKLMNKDNSSCKIYMARACQYTNDSMCTKDDWTFARFSPKILNATNEAIDKIKKQYHNKSFRLIGFSGGGAIASLVSNKRDDVNYLFTIAGNLNTKLWTKMKNISSLRGSLNPSDYTSNLQNITQYHMIGSKDKTMPKEVLFSYLDNFKDKTNIRYEIVDSTHSCCWDNSFQKVINNINYQK